MVPELRERYIQGRNAELKSLLEASAASHTAKFWSIHEKITKEAEILQRCLDGHRRSRIMEFIHEMLETGLMEIGDLSVFSSELQARVKSFFDDR